MKNKKKIALGATALAVVLVAAGTFAWFSTTDKTNPNIFGMDNFDVTITEDFDTPNVPLLPGTDITKEVGVTNSGNVPVVVRVKLEETLELLQQNTENDVDKLKMEYTNNNKATEAQVPVLISKKMIEAYTSANYTSYSVNVPAGVTVYRKTIKNGSNTVYSYLAYVTEESPLDSGNHHLVQVTPKGDDPVNPTGFDVKYAYNVKKQDTVTKGYTVTATHGKNDGTLDTYYGSAFHEAVVLNFDTNVQTNGNALEKGKNWYLAKDGYFYYTKALAGETISEPLLKSVSIKEKAGNALKGATYAITPVMQAVQMEHSAVTATWTDLTGYSEVEPGTVLTNDANGIKQMISNIIKTETHEGYYTAMP